MSAKSKLTLFLEMKDRLFNNKLSQVKKRFGNATGEMQNKVKRLGLSTTSTFRSMTSEVQTFS